MIFVSAALAAPEIDDGLQADHRVAARAPSHSTWPGRRLHRAQPQTTMAKASESANKVMTNLLLSVALDLAAGRRHRHHEHPARIGHRAHARDRCTHGGGRQEPAHPAAVPGRSHHAQHGRRPAGRTARRRCRTHGLVPGQLADAALGAGDPRPRSSSPAPSACFSDSIRRTRRRGWTRSRRCATSKRDALAVRPPHWSSH